MNVELRRPAPTLLRPANPTQTSIALGYKATLLRHNTCIRTTKTRERDIGDTLRSTPSSNARRELLKDLSEIQRENVGLFVSMLKVAKELQEAIPHTPSIVDPIKDEANRTVLSHNTT